MTAPIYHLTGGRVIVRDDDIPVAAISRATHHTPAEADKFARLVVSLLNAHAAGLVVLPAEAE